MLRCTTLTLTANLTGQRKAFIGERAHAYGNLPQSRVADSEGCRPLPGGEMTGLLQA